MKATVALRGRGQLALVLTQILQFVRQAATWHEPDARNMHTFRQFILAVLMKRSTRLIVLAQAVAPWRHANTVKSVAMGLAYFLEEAEFPMGSLSRLLLEGILRRIPTEQMATYGGKAVVVIDPTEYHKRSRGKGKGGNHMQYVGRVRKSHGKKRGKKKAKSGGKTTGSAQGKDGSQTEKTATTAGYVDVWAGLVLKGKQFLPLARQLFSSNHPKLKSQNKVEEAVLFQALGLLKRAKLSAIVVGDRGLGRKELMVRLCKATQDFVLRIDADINVWPGGISGEIKLDQLLAQQPWLGEVIWDRGEQGKLRCQTRIVTATIRFSRSGRKNDYQEARLNFVELVPLEGWDETLVLATTLPAATLVEAKGIARVYSWRWAIESGFETMKAWGLERFMVRGWKAIERLLWLVAIVYSLVVLARYDAKLKSLREQAVKLIKELAVLGRRLTVGKLAEAFGLDFTRHQRAWKSAWFL
jgi:hypothetical protein